METNAFLMPDSLFDSPNIFRPPALICNFAYAYWHPWPFMPGVSSRLCCYLLPHPQSLSAAVTFGAFFLRLFCRCLFLSIRSRRQECVRHGLRRTQTLRRSLDELVLLFPASPLYKVVKWAEVCRCYHIQVIGIVSGQLEPD